MKTRMEWSSDGTRPGMVRLLIVVLLIVGVWPSLVSGLEPFGNLGLQPKRSWGPEQVIGEPDTPGAGDLATAWASKTTDDQEEWLICEYSRPMVVSRILVHETYNPGALVRVTAIDANDEEIEIWKGNDPTPTTEERGVSEIPVELRQPLQKIKLYLDSPNVAGWNEIDAVGLEDRDGHVIWASHVKASSSYADRGERDGGPIPFIPVPGPVRAGRDWGPEQVIGLPDTHGAGDIVTAWASQTPDGQEEWLVCEYLEPVRVKKVVVHETFNPGAIVKILGYDKDGKEQVLWKGVDPTPRKARRGVSEFLLDKPFVTGKIKLIIDSPNVPGWNEIDAVAIVDDDDQIYWTARVTASSSFADQQVNQLPGAKQGIFLVEDPIEVLPVNLASDEVAIPKAELDALRKQVEDQKQEIETLRRELQKLKE